MEWVDLLPNTKQFNVLLKALPTKGNLAWEYNPLRNYRLSQSMYEYQGILYTLEELLRKGLDSSSSGVTERFKGELVDFITNELSFSPEHPVLIVPQYSYDGSVNLILNDGLNAPKLINTRFSTTGKDTYEIINRKGDGDTNIYDQGTLFITDTSLYKKVYKIPKLTLLNITLGGNLKVGNYHFYFTYTDADGNETDFVAESGLISLFIGLNNPRTVHTGNRDENSLKLVNFILSNIDSSYSYVLVYYSRTYAEGLEAELTSYRKILTKFLVNNSGIANILITGFDLDEEVTLEDINPMYNVVDYAKAHATAKNMLFLANVHKPEIPYIELEDLSLHFLPYLQNENYDLTMDENYNISSKSKGYYDPKYIYHNVGYWTGDLYRLGVVYILDNNELTPVFNIRGGINIPEYSAGLYHNYNYVNSGNLRIHIQYNESTNYVMPPESTEGTPKTSNTIQYENIKGVISLNSSKETNTIHAIEVRADYELINRLKNLGVKGFFFVRLKRMPLTLCEGITITTDNTSHTPTLPCKDSLINNVISDSPASYLSYDILNESRVQSTAVNYVSEGFLSRYKYKFNARKVEAWENFKKVALGTVVTAGIIIGTIFTFGAAGVAAGAGVAAVMAAGWTTASTITAILAGAIIGGGALIAAGSTYNQNHIALINPNTVTHDGRIDKGTIPNNYVELELEDSRKLNASFLKRVIIKGHGHNQVNAILCPEYDVNYPFLNQIFTGLEFTVKTSISQAISREDNEGCLYFLNNGRHFYIPAYNDVTYRGTYSCKILAVPDNVKIVMLDSIKFRSRAGIAEEAWHYESVGGDYKKDITKVNGDYKLSQDEDEDGENVNVEYTVGLINSDIIRGEFGPYLGMSNYAGGPCENVRIMIPGYNEQLIEEYIGIRMNDANPFYAISDRIDIENLRDYYLQWNPLTDNTNINTHYILHRGDCYICQFTHRINRNFKDPSAPYNDDCVDADSWKKNYTPLHPENYAAINLGDVNAVELGMWCTFRVRSSMNLNVRTLDLSNFDECTKMGHAKGFYPHYGMITEGTYKSEEALVYNKGFNTSLSQRLNTIEPDVPAFKNWYGTRIMYSDIQVTDAFKNNFRVFRGTHYRDYTRQYGEITKLINYNDNLVIVFEHGIGIVEVNEKMLAALSATNNAYITTKNVLPEDVTIVSDMFGSQWPESVIITPNRGDLRPIIFGVDTVGKKIWQYSSGGFKVISDFKVQEFLNNNITLGEREKTPLLGVRNVKTFYNAFKQDVMFTFYDNLTGFEEKAWNLCYNIVLEKFITFYSWIPSLMENIDNIPFSFDRNTAKWITKLGISHANNSFARGIVLNNNIYSPYTINSKIGTLGLADNIIKPLQSPGVTISTKFELCRDIYGNYKKFTITNNELYLNENYIDSSTHILGNDSNPNNDPDTITGEDAEDVITSIPQYFEPSLFTELYYRNKQGNIFGDWDANKVSYYDGGYVDSLDVQHTWTDYESYYNTVKNLPIYKAKDGLRPTLESPINANNLVLLLNIKCYIYATYEDSTKQTLPGRELPNNKICVGEYESTIAVTSTWNMQFLTTDFWKHGLAGLIDITDPIKPTYWYGKLHPFEFEVVVAGDYSQHKVFKNLQLLANKAEPDSFHYEIVGESYDFSKDKPNMYFRLEARKALFLYNGCDITYNHSFINITPKLFAKSAETIVYYTERLDTINDVYDYYSYRTSPNKEYDLLSGTEITYYPNRLEFRLWSHLKAVNIDKLSSEQSSAIVRGNCQYKEDIWYVAINPILIAYKNEYKLAAGNLFTSDKSTWVKAYGSDQKLPPITIYNTNIPNAIKEAGYINFPTEEKDSNNALYHLYDYGTDQSPIIPIDASNWLNDVSIYKYNFGEALNRREVDIKDRFMKVRIRYSGTELAIIDALKTIYDISYS